MVFKFSMQRRSSQGKIKNNLLFQWDTVLLKGLIKSKFYNMVNLFDLYFPVLK